ncbi:MAG TPA: hypothetical protein VLL72_04470 [Kiloniellales bacterium]|nr:hypothetical protein [Kiloniellales bacterium]
MTFSRPFVLGGFDEVQPAGTYCVETDEMPLDGISFQGHRRILTLIYLPTRSGQLGGMQAFTVDPTELESALARDRAIAALPVDPEIGQKTLD